MPRRVHIAALAALSALALGAAPARAGPAVAGVWSLGVGKAEIAISECGATLCGRIVDAAKIQKNPNAADKRNKDPQLRERKLKGLLVLTGFVGGPSEWKGGTIYNPSDGSTYRATLSLVNQDTLEVTGCIIRPLCKTTKLTRARNGETAKSAAGEGFATAKRGT
jgi:uncharacterized protein (DUF2147 family)